VADTFLFMAKITEETYRKPKNKDDNDEWLLPQSGYCIIIKSETYKLDYGCISLSFSNGDMSNWSCIYYPTQIYTLIILFFVILFFILSLWNNSYLGCLFIYNLYLYVYKNLVW
jgi:hypothetical protein